MNTFKKISLLAALIVAFAGTASADIIKIDTGGTIKSGGYETICDKKPKACGEHVELPPRPKPKPTPKPIRIYRPAGNISFSSIAVFR